MYKGSKLIILALLFLVFGAAQSVMAQDQPDLAGWGKDGEYNKLYETTEFDEFKGTVGDITEIKPLAGMAPGIGLKVKDQDGDMVNVHLAQIVCEG